MTDRFCSVSLVTKPECFSRSWQDVPTTRKVKAYAMRLAQACLDLHEFEQESAPIYQALVNYHQQAEEVVQRHKRAISLLATSHHDWAEADLKLAKERNQELITAATVVVSKVQEVNEQRQQFVDQREKVMQELMRMMQSKNSHEVTINPLECFIDERMLQPDTLKEYAEESLELEAAIAEATQEVSKPSEQALLAFGRNSDIDHELKAEQEVTENIKGDWARACADIRKLEPNSNLPEIKEQIRKLTEQRDWLGVQLALRGMPNRDGMFLRQIYDYDVESLYRSMEAERLWAGRSAVGTSNASDEHDTSSAEQETPIARGLFDSVIGLELPSSRHNYDTDMPMTESEFESMLQEKIVPKVEKWRNEVEPYETHEQAFDCEEPSFSDEGDDSIETLVESPVSERKVSYMVESSFDRSISYAADPESMSRREYSVRKGRLEAWVAQLAHLRKEVMRMVDETSPWIDMSGFREVGEPDYEEGDDVSKA